MNNFFCFNKTRERNREHAKRSRKRKKVFVETLEEMIVQLKSENEKMRTCMTQHFGSRFVQDLLSSSERTFVSPLPTSSHDSVLPKLTPSNSLSSVHERGNDLLTPRSFANLAAFPPTQCSSTTSPNNNVTATVTTTQQGQVLGLASNARWLAEEKTPKHLRRKNIMYRDKLSVLLPNDDSSSAPLSKTTTEHPVVSNTIALTNGKVSNMSASKTSTGAFVANPILS